MSLLPGISCWVLLMLLPVAGNLADEVVDSPRGIRIEPWPRQHDGALGTEKGSRHQDGRQLDVDGGRSATPVPVSGQYYCMQCQLHCVCLVVAAISTPRGDAGFLYS